MKFYRIKQFFWSITAKISIDELNYVKYHLNSKEFELFLMLSVQDQKHSVKVAKDVERECTRLHLHREELIKTALLHDIGKIYIRLNAIDKSILVLADKFTSGRIRNIRNSKKIDVYYNHGNIGFEILKSYGLSERAMYLIKNHHSDIKGDLELEILRSCDGKN
ncbi:MAG: HDIG domain-containing metalloprotein [Solirubrobacterales bacterium]